MPSKKQLVIEECDLGPEKATHLLLSRLQETISSTLQMQEMVQNLLKDRRFIPPRDRYVKVSAQFTRRVLMNECRIPELKLAGKWLYTIGFEHGCSAKVMCLFGMLIIIPGVEPPSNE